MKTISILHFVSLLRYSYQRHYLFNDNEEPLHSKIAEEWRIFFVAKTRYFFPVSREWRICFFNSCIGFSPKKKSVYIFTAVFKEKK